MMIRTIARLLVFVLLCSAILSISPLTASAAPTTTEYNNLLKLHLNNPNWSYQEYCAKINSIVALTDAEPQNEDKLYLNPWIYEKYDNLIVYGTPHGDFYVTSEGKMKNTSNGKIGEYQYLGYNDYGVDITNDRYFNVNASGGIFKTPSDYTITNWLRLDSNMRTSWGNLTKEQIAYLKTSEFFDDDYSGTPANRPATTLATFLAGKTIEEYAYVQVAPKILVGGSVMLKLRKPNSNLSWNTLIYEPLYPNLTLTGVLNTEDNTYRIPAGVNEVGVNAIITGTAGNCPVDLLDKMTFDYYGQSTSKTIGMSATQSVSFTRKYTRSNLKVGSNTVELTANISVSTKLNDPPKTITVKKTVTIIVDENINPYATCILTASPNNIIYKGVNMPVDLTVDYGVVGITDLSKISNVQVTVFNESGAFTTLSPVVSGSKTFNVTIPTSYMSGATTKDKLYEAQVTYNLTDYTKLTARASASVHIGPDPVPPPPPQPENNPPVCTLYAPQSVRAGDVFGAVLNAYDPDGDSLICDIISYPANTVSTTSDYKAKSLWYDKQYSGTTQVIIGTATDGKDGAGDSKYVAVTAPIVDARINVSGTLKANRQVSISDGSDTPKYYPIASRSWSITPVTAGLSSTDIKYSGGLAGVQSKDLIFKRPGQYRVTLTVTNSAGYSASTERIIDIQEDMAPVADFIGAETVYRNPQAANQVTYELFNKSYSPDNDYIGKMQVYIRHDSDNDGIFTSHTWTLAYDGASKDMLPLTLGSIGKYQIRLVVTESFGQPTLSEYLTVSDYLKSEVVKELKVDNLAPTFEFTQKKNNKIQIDILVDKENCEYTKEEILSRANSTLKPLLQDKFDLSVNVKYLNYYWDKYKLTTWYKTVYAPMTESWMDIRPWDHIMSTDPISIYERVGTESMPVFVGFNPNSIGTRGVPYYNDSCPVYFWRHLENGNLALYLVMSVRDRYLMGEEGEQLCWYVRRFEYPRVDIVGDIIELDFTSVYNDYPKEGAKDGNWYIGNTFMQNITKNLSNSELRSSNNEKVLVLFKNNDFDTIEKELLIQETMSNDIAIYGIGGPESKDSFNELAAANDKNGIYIDNSNLDTALNTLANDIKTRRIESTVQSEYVLLGESVSLENFYSDIEEDPYNTFSFSYNHTPSVFENNQGIDFDSGKSLLKLPTEYNKVGRYDITAKAQDKPTADARFLSYYKWSEPAQKTIYVHRKPFAEPSLTYSYDGNFYVLNLTDSSYDLDHSSRSDKGIVQKVWSYKDATDPNAQWIEGKLTSVPVNKKYYIKLEVMDMEYTWASKVITFYPDAKGSITIDPMARDWASTGVTVAIDYSGPEILSKLKYQVTGSDAAPTGGWTETTTASVQKTISQEGIHYVYAHGVDTSGSVVADVGGPYKIDLTPPIITINKTSGTYTPQLDLTISATDALSGVKSIRYAWSTSTSTPTTGWASVNNATVNVTQANEGVYYLYTESYDNVNNKSTVTRSGPFTIIRNRPPVLAIVGTTPSFLYEGDNVAVNFTVTDPDLDTITCNVAIKKGGSTVWSGLTTVTPSGGIYPVISLPTIQSVTAGSYTVEITARDPYNAQNYKTSTFTVNALGITGRVSHTAKWEENRIKYNNAVTAAGKETHSPQTFFPGERYVLHADTTPIDPRSSVTATMVRVTIVGTSFSATLVKNGANSFDGDIWDEVMLRWGDRTVDFRFDVTYSNGSVKSDTVRTYIKDDDYWRLHLQF